jgi:hypothetical protein
MNRELKMRRISTIFVAVFAAIAMMALPVQAFAAAGDPNSDPTASQYENPGSKVTQGDSDDQEVSIVTTPSDSGGSGSSSSGSLPFTGFDVGILALVALLLGATGLALRRLSAVK